MAAERREKGEREGAAPPHTTHAHTQFREGEVRERKVREEGEDHTVAITHPHHSYTAAHTGIEETKPSSPPSLSVPHRPMHHSHWISSQLHTHPSTKDQTSSSPPIVCSAAMTQRIRPLLLVLFFLAMVSNSVVVCTSRHQYWRPSDGPEGASYCLSWRLAVEANNVRAWRTVPTQCLRHVESYMIGGQYDRDINFIIDHVISYLDGVDLSNDGLDAWILDVDDTCISNLIYYKGKRFGCDPYDPDGFKTWALRGGCPAIPGVLRLFNKLIGNGFKVFLVTGRDESTFGQATLDNLQNQGFIGYQRLILRNLGGVVIEVGFCLKILLKEICTSYNSNFPISHAS